MDYSILHEDKKRGTFDFPIELYYVDYTTPRYNMPLHWHMECELILVLNGELHLTLNDNQYKFCQGESVWIGSGVIHGAVPKDCVYECVVFDLEALMKSTPVCSNSKADYLLNSDFLTGPLRKNSDSAIIADKIFEAMEKEQTGYEFVTVGLMWQLLGILIKDRNKLLTVKGNCKNQIYKFKPVLSYIRENYSSEITLDALAKITGMTPRYFCRAFSNITGKTPMSYVNYYRIEIACERLRMTDESVTETAFACGFNDVSYFTKQFKKMMGVTPVRYRKRELLYRK